jgi:hypothetical protein
MSKYDKLRNLTIHDIGLFNLSERTTVGKIIQITDPTHFQMIIGLDNVMFRFHCKLDYSVTSIDHPSVNRLLQLATDCKFDTNQTFPPTELQTLVNTNEKLLTVKCGNFDKDGNLLVELFEPNDVTTSIQSILAEEGHILSYVYDPVELFKFNTL